MKAKKLSNSNVFSVALTLFLSVFLWAGSSVWGVQWPKDVTAISPAPGATVHMVLVGIGKPIQKHTPIENWIVQPLGGPKLWLPMMKQGRAHFASHNSADILNAFLGRGLYAKMGPQDVRTVMAGHDYMFMFWTTPDTGIKTISDLKGKIVYAKFKANPMFDEITKHQLASAGLTVKDLKAVLAFSSIKEAIRGLIEGRVDAILYPVVPGAVMQINEAKGETKFIALTSKQAEYVVSRMEGYYIQDIAANDPRFRNKSPVPNAICYQTALFTSAAMHPDIVYGVVKAILEHSDEFVDIHPSARYWSVNYRPVNMAVPYHEGAIRYFKEIGLWKPENQAYQEKMLKK
ncbi:MAG: TAXI family TRAP transporter solute-binding subunit [Deltaproteobacteria bacterium]|nr:TAXI family TRAP transporter solute-binding subunit [Deltaproteobacteria bacterium]